MARVRGGTPIDSRTVLIRPQRIVLTGGPGAGKTVIARLMAAARPGRLALVPEAATHVYSVLQTRWDKLDARGQRDVQRRIYRHQVEQESHAAREHPGKALLLDRGTIDGAAYWPEGPDDYWRDLGTAPGEELARYDAVIWMQTGAALGHYDGDASNPVRFENPEAAVANGALLATLWGSHPHVVRVEAYAHFNEKVAAVSAALEQLLAGG